MNNYFLKILNNQKGGTALMMTMMVLSSVLFIALATSDVVRNGMIASKSQVYSTKAYFAAESGAERILWEIRKNHLFTTTLPGGCVNNPSTFCYDNNPYGEINACDNVCASQEQSLLSGEATYTVTYETIPPDIVLTSTGTFIDPKNQNARLRRIIKIYY